MTGHDRGAPLRVLVVNRRRDLAEQVRAAWPLEQRPHVAWLPRTTQLPATLGELGPWDLLVAGPSEASRSGLRRLALARGAAPGLGMLLVSDGRAAADARALVQARPDEMLSGPVSDDRLRVALRAVVERVHEREQRARQEERAATAVGDAAPRGRVHVVGGPGGGSGKTTVALSLATLLAQRGRRVALVDLDVQFGTVAAAVHARSALTIHEVLFDERDRRADDATVAETLADGLTVVEGGFRVLPAPRDPVLADGIGAAEVSVVLGALRTQVDDVVVDTGAGFGEVTLAALDLADDVVVVSAVDVPSTAILGGYLTVLDQLDVSRERVRVVLNKDLDGTGVRGADIAEVLDRPVHGTVPFSVAVPRALNSGRPLPVAEPGDAATAAVRAALRALLPAGPADAAPAAAAQPGLGRRWATAVAQLWKQPNRSLS